MRNEQDVGEEKNKQTSQSYHPVRAGGLASRTYKANTTNQLASSFWLVPRVQHHQSPYLIYQFK